MPCEHPEFDTAVSVRRTPSQEATVDAIVEVDVRVRCHACQAYVQYQFMPTMTGAGSASQSISAYQGGTVARLRGLILAQSEEEDAWQTVPAMAPPPPSTP